MGEEFESAKLWRHVSDAIDKEDQHAATEQKSILEEAQRAGARERKEKEEAWVPRFFELDNSTDQYVYIHSDVRPWDPLNDLHTYESNYVICTKTKHKTPMVRTQSIISVSDEIGQPSGSGNVPNDRLELTTGSRESSSVRKNRLRGRRGMTKNLKNISGSSQEETGGKDVTDRLGLTKTEEIITAKSCSPRRSISKQQASSSSTGDDGVLQLEETIRPLKEQNRMIGERLNRLQGTLDQMITNQRERDSNSNLNRDMVLLVILIVMIQAVLNWILSTRAHQMANGGGGPVPPHPN